MRNIKLSAVILALITAFIGIALLASCSEKEPPNPEIPDLPASEGLTFEALTDENGRIYYAVTGMGECTDTTLVIPHEYNGAPVEEIADEAFHRAEGMTELIVPGTVKRVGTFAFANAKGLEKVTLCNGVTTLCDSAFDHATELHTVKLPKSLKHIGTFAFLDCNISEITIPDGIEYIGQKILGYTPYSENPENWENGLLYFDDILLESDSKALEGVCTVRDGTRIISSLAFAGADLEITEVVFPESVEILCESVFWECINLKRITLPNSIRSMGYGVFAQCIALEEVTLPDSITHIPSCAFEYCDMKAIIIPDGVTHIEADAFGGCEELTDITLPQTLTYIGDEAFRGCSNLPSIELPEGLTYVGEYAFDGKMTEIILPDSLIEIGKDAFESCNWLTTVTMGSNIKKIGYRAFPKDTVTDIYYSGTKEQWEQIEGVGSIGGRITVHYGST